MIEQVCDCTYDCTNCIATIQGSHETKLKVRMTEIELMCENVSE